MAFLQQGNSAVEIIPAGQSIIIGAFRGAVATFLTPTGAKGGPQATISNSSTTFGSYVAATTVTIGATLGEIEYVIAASPALTDSAYAAGAVVITGGSVNGTPIGAGTPSTGSFTSDRFTSILSALTDSSGTPGNVTNNAAHGRAAFSAAGTSVVVTNSLCAATSSVFVSLGGADATLTSIRVTPGAGSFTVTANAAATGITPFDFLVMQT